MKYEITLTIALKPAMNSFLDKQTQIIAHSYIHSTTPNHLISW